MLHMLFVLNHHRLGDTGHNNLYRTSTLCFSLMTEHMYRLETSPGRYWGSVNRLVGLMWGLLPPSNVRFKDSLFMLYRERRCLEFNCINFNCINFNNIHVKNAAMFRIKKVIDYNATVCIKHVNLS